MTWYDDVREFHYLWHFPPETPRRLPTDVYAKRIRLINEEYSEMSTAYALGDEIEFADALVDFVWVILGTAVEAGLPFNSLWEEVKKANMAKRGATVDASGKLQKPPGWKPPDIASVLARFR